jgi:hypothetical protein
VLELPPDLLAEHRVIGELGDQRPYGLVPGEGDGFEQGGPVLAVSLVPQESKGLVVALGLAGDDCEGQSVDSILAINSAAVIGS